MRERPVVFALEFRNRGDGTDRRTLDENVAGLTQPLVFDAVASEDQRTAAGQAEAASDDEQLDKPPVAESADFVRRRFASRSIGIDEETSERIVRESENIPYYLQQLSSLVFESVVGREGDWVEEVDIAAAIDGLIDENADYYCERLSSLSASQRMLLSALSRESAREFTADYRQRHSLAGSSSVHTALKVLVEGGIVESADGEYSVGDPFFARYVRALPYVAS